MCCKVSCLRIRITVKASTLENHGPSFAFKLFEHTWESMRNTRGLLAKWEREFSLDVLNGYVFTLSRCDYENVESEGANQMIELLRKAAEDGSLVNKTLTGGSGNDQKSYQVKSMDNFSYTDPIDGSVSNKQVLLPCN